MTSLNHREKIFVTGGAGFIGSNLADRLLGEGHRVVIFDNFSTGQEKFLKEAGRSPSFTLVRGDLLDYDLVAKAMSGCHFVYHLAANADVRFGLEHPRKDLDNNTVATYHVLEAMRANTIKRIAFASTGAIYGDSAVIPTPEDTPFPIQTSLYGASKLAAEGMIQAYCEGFDFQSWIFRFAGILGERYTHGHVFDFYKQLLDDPAKLHVLGDGAQRKSYIYVQDCINAIFMAVEKASEKVNIFNLGVDGYCTVNDSIRWITQALGLSPKITYAGGARGWVGDNPFIFLDTKRIRSLGWQPTLTIEEGIARTLRYHQANAWVLERR